MQRRSVTGLPEVRAALQGFRAAMKKRILRAAARSWSAPMRDGLRNSPTVPEESRALRRSTTVKVKTYGNGKVIARVGPRTDFRLRYARQMKKRGGYRIVTGKKSLAKLQPDAIVERRPARYAHLADKGRTGEYMARVEQSNRSTALTAFISKTRDESEREARKLGLKVG